MMKLTRGLTGLAVFLAASALFAGAAPAQTFDGRAYVDRAIELVRGHALASTDVDWPAVTAEMHRRAGEAHDAFDLYPALVHLLNQLGDQHSFLQLSSERSAAYQAAKGIPFRSAAAHRPVAERHFSGRQIAAADLPVGRRRVRWIVVPGFSGDRAATAAFARTLYGQASEMPARCGYILDFRGNGGGNMWPMLAGLTPFLANGDLGAFVEPRERAVVFHRDGAVGTRTGAQEQVIQTVSGWRQDRALRTAPVAILIDGGSGSSGEIVPILFAGRAKTRFIGTPTYGASTSTEGFQLPDGANLVIATSSLADRRGRIYPHGLAPDAVVRYGADGGDAPLEAARRWLAGQAGCRT